MTARLLVDAVSVYRLTKLATDDSITQPLRDFIIECAYDRAGRRNAAAQAQQRWGVESWDWNEGDWQRVVEEDELPPKLATLVTCRWCAGMWVALGLVYLVRRRRWWPAMSDALALSAAGALLARLED